jgi:hypothetical protein
MSAYILISGDVTGPNGGVADGDLAVYNGTSGKVLRSVSGRLPRAYLAGYGLANNATDVVNDLNIAVGECRDDTNVYDIILSTALVKRLDAAWAAGTNAGGLDTGTVTDNTYHIYAIGNPSTGASDVLFSLSAGLPVMPSGYTMKRRIGSLVRNIAWFSGWCTFRQIGDRFTLKSVRADITDFQYALGAVADIGLKSVPAGFKFLVNLKANAWCSGAAFYVVIQDIDVSDNFPALGASGTAIFNVVGWFDTWTNTAAGVHIYFSSAPNGGMLHLNLNGVSWLDTRGRLD